MQSKQKTRTQPRKQKKQKAASKASPSRSERKRNLPFGVSRTVRAPLASAREQRKFWGWRFSTAPPHDEFPEGGLRVVGQLPGGISSGAGFLNGDYSGSNYGLFSTNGTACCLVSPTGSIGSAASVRLFDTGSSLCNIANYFRRYRFRRLVGHFSPAVSAATVETRNLQLGYERDPFSGPQVALTAGSADAQVNASSVRFASWEPDVDIPFIDQMRHDRADELWYVTPQNDTVTITNAAEMRMAFQGCIMSALKTLPTAAETIYGDMLYSFVLDLYGLNNVSSGALPAERRRASARSDKGDSKSDEKDGFVDLTPRQTLRTPSKK